MNLIFSPYDFQYKIKNGKVFVYLYGKTHDETQKYDETKDNDKTTGGKPVCVIIEHQPYFYAQLDDIIPYEERLTKLSVPLGNQEWKVNGKITHREKVERELLGRKKTFYKIFVNIPKAVPPLSKELENLGIKTHEKDILFIHRFLRDTGISPSGWVEAEGGWAEESAKDDLKESSKEKPERKFTPEFFLAEKISFLPAQSISKENLSQNLSLKNTPLKILALDIETYAKTKIVDFQINPILMIGLSGMDEQGNIFQKVITWKSFPHQLPYVEIVADEKAMLQRFQVLFLEYGPDFVTGYNSDGFDFPYLKARAEKLGVIFNLGKDGSELTVGEREAKIAGIPHLDLYQFIKRIFGRNLKTDTYSLDAVAFELLGYKKHAVNLDTLHLAWDEGRQEQLEEFCKYNLHDADLTLKLCQKLLPDMIEFSQLTGLPLFDVIRMSFSRLVEGYILKRAMSFGIIAPNKPTDYEMQQRMQERYEGGFVYEPTPGLYKDIAVFDFRSLYPSIITAHNVSPESFCCSCCKEKETAKVPGFSEYWFCQQEKKFLPTILDEVTLRRAEVKKQLKQVSEKERSMLEARSYALKLLANSFYGYLGFSGARWYHFPSARATTAYARNYIHDTMKKAEESGFKVVYGDTDSTMLLLGKQSLADAKAFMTAVNKHLPGHMELEMESFYPRGIFVALKHGEKGAKKKYALLREDGKIKITGFETVRRNWSLLAKEVQKQVLCLVLEEKVPEALLYVRKVIEELKSGKVAKEKLIIRTKITRDIDRYASAGPHVIIARRMHEQGFPVSAGMIVEYIIVKGSGLVRERAALVHEVKDNYDAEYYLNHQIIPAVASIFAVFGYKEDQIFSETRQTGLESWG